jgi:hypothetical protein
MTADAALGPGERLLATWSARVAGSGTVRPASGDLVLTNRRLVFVAKGGVFARSRPAGSDRSLPLETVGGAAPHRSEMRIGYGDRMVIDGIEVGGAVYELGREGNSRATLTAIAAARELRRRELGLPDDLTACGSCGRWVPFGTNRCASCVNARAVSS